MRILDPLLSPPKFETFSDQFLDISSDSKHFSFSFLLPGGRGPLICVSPKSFCDIKPHAKFHNPTVTPSVRKVIKPRERKRRQKLI
jgi:hypothetical protein